MTDLFISEADNALLARRLAEFAVFKAERLPVLHQFVEAIGGENAYEVLIAPAKFLPLLEQSFNHLVVEEHNRVWLITRIGYFVGEYLLTAYDGCWQVDEDPRSRAFARYVVGDFSYPPRPGLSVDPFDIAQRYVDAALPRSLVGEIERGVQAHQG